MVADLSQINLLTLVSADTKLKRTATTEGGEFHGPCPFCGGDDRFYVQPFHEGKARWYCRHCSPKGGDAIDYIMKREGLGYIEAREYLEFGAPEPRNGNGKSKTPKATSQKQKQQLTVTKTPVDKSQQTITRTFAYHYPDGTKAYEVVRFDNPKEYKPRDGQGWSGVFKRHPRLLYALPAVLHAVANRETVLIVEGEKTAEALHDLGYVITTLPGGAKAPLPDELTTWLANGRIVILRDQDHPGHEYGTRLARALHGKMHSLKVIDLPVRYSDTHGQDAEDWYLGGGTREHLESMIRAAPEFEPGYNLTDLGNAKRLVSQHGRDLRYCHVWGKWLIWDGKRWAVDETGEIERRAKSVVIGIYAEAANDQLARDDRDSIVNWARSSESKRRIRDMIELAESEPGIPILPSQLDCDQYLLNVSNGTIDLRTGSIYEHRREDMITKLAPVDYRSDAPAPLWKRFLHRIMAGNTDVLQFLQRAIGYSLTGDTGEQVLFMLYGMGANGKSTFLNALQDVLGDYANQAPTSMLIKKREASGPTNDVARLMGARFVTAIETGDGQQMDEQLVKQLTGGDKITARFLHREFFEFKPVAKLFVATNHKPVIRGSDNAIWRRIRLIPFTETIPPEERDKHLPDKLRAEFSGILSWAVRGCIEWQANGLPVPEAVLAATSAYRAEMDILLAFLNDCCVIDPHARITAADFYQAYQDWCEDTGERTISQRKIGLSLSERGFRNARITAGPNRGRIEWLGIGLSGEEMQVVNKVNEVNEETTNQRIRENARGETYEAPSLPSLASLCQQCGKELSTAQDKWYAIPLVEGGGFLCRDCSDVRRYR